jgi:NAD(P)-dependent dehydrogenase (short-subunit alcohol dehydrogenase family)
MKTIAIVGIGPGIGSSVAKRFASEGYSVAALSRKGSASGDNIHSFTADASDEASLEKALTQVKEKLSPPEILVYNVAAIHQGMPSSLSATDLIADFTVNVAGALTASHLVIPEMKKQGRGTILFTGGGLALNPSAAYSSLSIGKAGIRSLAYSFAEELKPANIHVATVTVAGFVKAGTSFDPDKIAAHYWRLHTQPKEAWETEHLFKGES